MPEAPEMRDSELLMPWYATDRLDDLQMAQLEAELAGDPELTRRLDLVRGERDETIALNQALGLPSAAARDALFARIDEEMAARPRRPNLSVVDRATSWFSSLSPRAMALAATAAALLIVAQAGFIGIKLEGRDGSGFVTASAPDDAAAGEKLLVGFVPEATSAQVTALLRKANARIVNGPRPGGLYEIRIADHQLADGEREAAIASFRAETGVVRFADRAN